MYLKKIMPAISYDAITKMLPTLCSNLIYGRMLNKDNHHGPLFLTWYLTFDCNLNCKFCSTHDIKRNYAANMSLEKCLELADEIAKSGTRVVGFTGGEPLIDDRLFPVIRRLKQHGLIVYIVTNGLLLSAKAADIIDSGVDYITVSIDSNIAEEHDDMRRHSGVFEAALKGIEKLKSLRHGDTPQVKTTTVLHAGNYKRIEGILDFLSGYADHVSIQPITGGQANGPHGKELSDIKESFYPPEDEIRNILKNLSTRYPFLKQKYYRSIPDFWYNGARLKDVACWSPFLRLLVYPNGSAAHCTTNVCMSSVGNIHEASFMSVWNSAEMKKQRELIRTGNNKCLCWTHDVAFNALFASIAPLKYLPVLNKKS